MINKNLRHLFEFIISNKEPNYDKYKNFISISHRSWYRYLNQLNVFLKSENHDLVLVPNENLSNKNLNLYKKILKKIYAYTNLELNNYEIAFLAIKEIYENSTLKISWFKNYFNLTNNDLKEIEKIISCYINDFFLFKKPIFVTKEKICNFLFNWLSNYLGQKNYISPLSYQNFKEWLPIKIFINLNQLIPFTYFDNINILLNEINYKNISTKEFFSLSIFLYVWSFYSKNNINIFNLQDWVLPNEQKHYLLFLLKEKDLIIDHNEIQNLILKIFELIAWPKNLQLNNINFFVNIICSHLSNYATNDFLDKYNFEEYINLKINYPLLNESIIKCFHTYLNGNDSSLYYLLIYFVNYIRENITFYPLKIITVCFGGMGMSAILKNQIQKHFINAEIEQLAFAILNSTFQEQKYDLIFSTMNLDFIEEEQYILIKNNDLLNQQIFSPLTWKKIYNILSKK